MAGGIYLTSDHCAHVVAWTQRRIRACLVVMLVSLYRDRGEAALRQRVDGWPMWAEIRADVWRQIREGVK